MTRTDIQDIQRTLLLSRLESIGQTGGALGVSWKVLILDSQTKSILSPTIKVKDLRSAGVTLFLLVNAQRQPVAEIPAVYFVFPTRENFESILKDMKVNLYADIYLEFATRSPDSMLEWFAKEVAGLTSSGVFKGRVMRYVDAYLGYTALSPGSFTLGVDQSYSLVHDDSQNKDSGEAFVERCATGISSVLLSLPGSLSSNVVFKSVKSDVAGQICSSSAQVFSTSRALIAGQRSGQKNGFNDSSGSHGSGPTSSSILAFVVDRDMAGLGPMVLHSWTYEALIDDLFGERLNQVLLPGSSTATELDESNDLFWKDSRGCPFPDVAASVGEKLTAYNKNFAAVSQTAKAAESQAGSNASDASARAVKEAMSNLAEMQQMKKSLDLHTSMSTKILSAIKERGIDKLFELELSSVSMSAASGGSGSGQASGSGGSGGHKYCETLAGIKGATVDDRIRAGVFLVCQRPDINLETILNSCSVPPLSGDDRSKMERILKRVKTTVQFANQLFAQRHGVSQQTSATSSLVAQAKSMAGVSSTTGAGGVAFSMAEQILSKGEDLVSQGLKKLMSKSTQVEKSYPVIGLLRDAIEGTGNMSVIDSKTAASSTSQYETVVLFIVGPGSYGELHAVSEFMRKAHPGKSFLYGATEMCSSAEFMKQVK